MLAGGGSRGRGGPLRGGVKRRSAKSAAQVVAHDGCQPPLQDEAHIMLEDAGEGVPEPCPLAHSRLITIMQWELRLSWGHGPGGKGRVCSL